MCPCGLKVQPAEYRLVFLWTNMKEQLKSGKTPATKSPKRIWDVGDIDPVTMFPKDCRYFNGGYVATEEEQSYWEETKTKRSKKSKVEDDVQ